MNNKIKFDISLERNKTYIFFIILTSIFLNHSNRNYGMNISLADIFIVISVLSLIIKKEFVLPVYTTMFFILLSIFSMMTSVLYTPTRFNLNISHTSIMKDYIKLVVSFLFLLFGYNISRIKMLKTSIKWYSVGAFLISLFGLILTILNIDIFKNLMYYADSRFRGLMIDPNYYSVIQCTTLVYFLRNKNIKTFKKVVIYIFNIIFIVMSGSKTGMLTLLIYSIFLLFEYLLVFRKTSYKAILTFIILIILLIISYPVLLNLINIILKKTSQVLPIFNRVELLFKDFSSAIMESGSGRDTTWRSATEIIRISPIFGVGIGTYIEVNRSIFGSSSVAHNTFLQIYAEWGGVLATAFFGYIFILLANITFRSKNFKYNSIILILRDILIILLIGSFAISLNNARMFWMFLGGFIYLVKKYK